MTHSQGIGAARAVTLIHLALFGGVALIAVVALVLRALGGLGPRQPVSLALALAAASVVAMAVAAAVLRPRVPARPDDQAPDEYWAAPANRAAAIVLWAVLEGAALLGVVGYLLTGALTPAVAVLLALVLGFLFRPAALSG